MSELSTEESAAVEALESPRSSPATKKVGVKQFIDPAGVKADIEYSLTDLSNAMQEQSGLYLEYGRLASLASRQVNDLKLVLEVTEARVYRELRDKATEAGEKVTEARLEKDVAVHDKVIAIKRMLNEAKQIESFGKTTLEAFGQRKDMLVQHGAKDRVEMQGDLRIAGAIADREDQKAREERILKFRKERTEGAA